FCKALTQRELVPPGWEFTLPTEAQWEYACRAGTTTKHFWGNDINPKLANYKGSGLKKTRAVGSYRPNAWGFFDMHGNVREWTANWYGSYPSGIVNDPVGPASGSSRVTRGGSWGSVQTDLRYAKRFPYTPSGRNYIIGFRVGFQSSK
ncbi:MAG: hypothetical protein CMI23_10615, partial [Opitutae bacterium]|nr:hypothetical protein [Opitutae bacterium]